MPRGCCRRCRAPAPHALALAVELALAVGARPLVLEAERHDRWSPAISHLPFLVASALTAAVAEVGADDPTVWDVAAGGFRDTSRVAASDTQMFFDILLTNRAAVLAQVKNFQEHLGALHDLLAAEDEAALRATLTASQQARAAWKPRRA
jgi:prephenate dehydrogenase